MITALVEVRRLCVSDVLSAAYRTVKCGNVMVIWAEATFKLKILIGWMSPWIWWHFWIWMHTLFSLTHPTHCTDLDVGACRCSQQIHWAFCEGKIWSVTRPLHEALNTCMCKNWVNRLMKMGTEDQHARLQQANIERVINTPWLPMIFDSWDRIWVIEKQSRTFILFLKLNLWSYNYKLKCDLSVIIVIHADSSLHTTFN